MEGRETLIVLPPRPQTGGAQIVGRFPVIGLVDLPEEHILSVPGGDAAIGGVTEGSTGFAIAS